jgi:cytochrome c oxidase assembly factor CtaG
MSYLTGHWSLDPFLIVVAVVVGWHEIGLRRLARRSRPERTRQRRQRSIVCYAGLAVLLLAVESPIDYWSDDYFFVHMSQHLLLMFAAPTLVVVAAPWQPMLDALPAAFRHRVTRSALTGAWSRPLRGLRAAAGPWASIATFNLVMIAWHVPALFDLAARSQFAHIWLMHGSFFAAGLWFWIQFVPSPPLRRRMSLPGRLSALVTTNVVMWLLAMSLSIFATHSWYAAYSGIPGVTLPPLADQQIGAAILWVCGDFWCFPAVVLVVRRMMMEEGGIGPTIEKILRQGQARRGWTSAPVPPAPAGGAEPPPAR